MQTFKLINHTVTMSRREIIRGLAAGSVVVLAEGCAYNEELGRSQLLFVSSGQMAQLAATAWTDLKKEQPTTKSRKYTDRMNRVAPKIISASGNNPADWEVQVFDSEELNAFALPGGKIGFYTGILDIMENDAQIATVMGHEVAHVNYNHAGERYSQSTLAQTGLVRPVDQSLIEGVMPVAVHLVDHPGGQPAGFCVLLAAPAAAEAQFVARAVLDGLIDHRRGHALGAIHA